MREIVNESEVPAAEMESPTLRALTEMAIMIASLDNDRYSLPKELNRGHTGQNLYTVMRHHACTAMPDAIREATRLRDRIRLRFLRLADKTRPRLSAAGTTYLDGLGYGIVGNAEWGQRAPRYVSTGDDPGPANQAPLTWADSPMDTRTAPLPYPTTAWWRDSDL
ncbi:hypothetical protein [Nonomuraea sp. NPDC050643]|uniref:terpene synthase family protein n=1 Tax=Nonomuraea sp. NPDC050643 TaxID=3155660 RepID=UPI0033C0135E